MHADRRTDECLALGAQTGSTADLHALVSRFRPMIWGMASDRYLPGGDQDDLIQEGMVGLWHAVRDFHLDRGPFGPFARLCADRQMWAAVTRANRQRHSVLRDAASYEDWMDIADADQDPAVIRLQEDARASLESHIHAVLSSLESEALSRYASGESYDDIAAALDVHRKRIDNALQRARRKIIGLQEIAAFVAA